jgi:DNA (cytosine-5)-methyltransferase 1
VTFADLFCGIGGVRIALERVGIRCVKSCEIDRFCRSIYKKNFGAEPEVGDIREWQSTSSRRGFPVKTSASPVNAQDSQEIEAGYSGSLCEFWNSNAPAGFSLRTCPDFCLPTEAEISPSFYMPWAGSGMAWRGEYLMLDTSDSPNDAVECELSDVLEHPVPSRFYLSPRAARGILRRAEKRGRTLPIQLLRALQGLAAGAVTTGPTSLSEPSAEPKPTTETQIPLHGTTFYRQSMRRECATNAESESGAADQCLLSMDEANTASLLVRRLTPTECERLQGFPDNWTRLTDRVTRRSGTQSPSQSSNGSGGE